MKRHVLDSQPLSIEQAKIIGPNVQNFLDSLRNSASEEGHIPMDQKKIEMCMSLAAQIPSLVLLIEELEAEVIRLGGSH